MLAVAGVLGGALPAAADDAGDLALSVVVAPPDTLVSPGDPIQYELEATLTGAPVGTFTVQLTKSGALAEHPRGLTVAVDLCTAPWDGVGSAGASCATGAEHAFTAGPADDDTAGSPLFVLDDITSTQPRYILVTLSVEDSLAARSDTTLMGIAADYDLAFTAAGDDTAVIDLGPEPGGADPGGSALPMTGVDAEGLHVALAIAGAAIVLGTALLLMRRRSGTRR